MRILRFRAVAGFVSGAAIIAGALVASTSASASPVLTPPPASFQACKTVGNGFICDGSTTFTYGPLDQGIGCGSGAGAFDIFDQGTLNVRLIDYYDADGNQTRQVGLYHAFSQYSNPLTGAAVPYMQHETVTDVLAVPGDLTTDTETITGEFNFTVPHMGAVALNAGRFVDTPLTGTVLFSAGPQAFNDYFFNGNTAAVAELCTALGAS